MEESMDSWLKNILEESSSQWKYWEQIYTERSEKEFAWNGYFKAYLEQTQQINGKGLLLTGPDGCGKHTAARCMMHHLKKKKYQRVFLSGFWLDGATPEAALAKIGSVLEALHGKQKDLCLLVEELEEHPFRREVLNYLGRMLRDYGLKMDTSLFLILIDRDERTIPSVLRDQLQLCRMSLPDLNQRTELILQHKDAISHRLSVDYFAQITEGLSCAQLKDLVVSVCWMMDSRKIASSLSNGDLQEFCKQQTPPPAPEDAMPSIAHSVRELVEKLPQILKEMPTYTASAPQTAIQPLPEYKERVNEKKFEREEVKRIEKLSPAQLAGELFSDGLDDFLAQIDEQVLLS